MGVEKEEVEGGKEGKTKGKERRKEGREVIRK